MNKKYILPALGFFVGFMAHYGINALDTPVSESDVIKYLKNNICEGNVSYYFNRPSFDHSGLGTVRCGNGSSYELDMDSIRQELKNVR